MLTWQAPPDAPATGRVFGAVAAMIATIGEDRFEERILAALRGVVAAEHCSTFLSDPGEGVRCLGAASLDGSRAALCAAEHYVAGYWQEDPALRQLRGTSFDAHAGVGRITSDEIRNPAYRRDCYEASRVLDRIALYRDIGGRRLILSIYRGPRTGFFARDDLHALGLAADALTAGFARHYRLRMRPPEPVTAAAACDDPARISRLLEALCPQLSTREQEVCALSVLGRTSGDIADLLGIRMSSVITYRKRAYAKLEVSSPIELAAQCLRAAGIFV